uniref:Uncharacterized protein n=1 Tax=Opuntia streptacantha TaxID=393608 RepID=A0A7C8YC28_OPUST
MAAISIFCFILIISFFDQDSNTIFTEHHIKPNHSLVLHGLDHKDAENVTKRAWNKNCTKLSIFTPTLLYKEHYLVLADEQERLSMFDTPHLPNINELCYHYLCLWPL